MPSKVRTGGVEYRHQHTFKHDFFAATGIYEGPDGLVVLKLNRMNGLGSIPLTWIGRFLMRREAHFYQMLDGTPGVPRFVGTVGETGLLHEFVPGRPLGRDEAVGDVFFDQLFALIEHLHERDIAYVDLNKRQNILVGDDGRPYLIDFQISLDLPPRGWRRWAPFGWFLRRFQHGDKYHCCKHKKRVRPDLLTDEERILAEEVGFWIRLHRRISHPLREMRRRLKRRLKASETVEVAGSSAK